MANRILIFLTLAALVVSACNQGVKTGKEEPVARVYAKYLYKSDIEDITQKGYNEADSITLVKDYIDNWVFKQLMLHRAEEVLSEEDQDVKKQIEDYRTSLLIYKYEQKYIRDNIDTIVSNSEIETYYSEYSSNFILNQAIVKALLVKIPKEAPMTWRVRSWYRSEKSEDLTKLEQYCFENNGEIISFENQWYQFSVIEKLIPGLPYTTENFLKFRNSIELKDENTLYFLKIYDHHLAGETAPIEYVVKDIRSILINKQKLKLINDLESDIYNSALDRGNFNIY